MSFRPIILAAALVATSLVSSVACAETYATYDSGDSSELLTALPGDNIYHVLYSVNIGTVNSGDILVVNGVTELSNEVVGTSVIWTSGVVLTSSATSTTGTNLAENNNFGCEHTMHHCVTVKPSIKPFPSGSSSTYVNFIAKADGAMTVEQDYGRLQIIKISP